MLKELELRWKQLHVFYNQRIEPKKYKVSTDVNDWKKMVSEVETEYALHFSSQHIHWPEVCRDIFLLHLGICDAKFGCGRLTALGKREDVWIAPLCVEAIEQFAHSVHGDRVGIPIAWGHKEQPAHLSPEHPRSEYICMSNDHVRNLRVQLRDLQNWKPKPERDSDAERLHICHLYVCFTHIFISLCQRLDLEANLTGILDDLLDGRWEAAIKQAINLLRAPEPIPAALGPLDWEYFEWMSDDDLWQSSVTDEESFALFKKKVKLRCPNWPSHVWIAKNMRLANWIVYRQEEILRFDINRWSDVDTILSHHRSRECDHFDRMNLLSMAFLSILSEKPEFAGLPDFRYARNIDKVFLFFEQEIGPHVKSMSDHFRWEVHIKDLLSQKSPFRLRTWLLGYITVEDSTGVPSLDQRQMTRKCPNIVPLKLICLPVTLLKKRVYASVARLKAEKKEGHNAKHDEGQAANDFVACIRAIEHRMLRISIASVKRLIKESRDVHYYPVVVSKLVLQAQAWWQGTPDMENYLDAIMFSRGWCLFYEIFNKDEADELRKRHTRSLACAYKSFIAFPAREGYHDGSGITPSAPPIKREIKDGPNRVEVNVGGPLRNHLVPHEPPRHRIRDCLPW